MFLLPIATSNDNEVQLVDIPDVVGDISIIQPLLAKQRDPAKMLIWMEVFKRSVIRARPIQPFVKLSPMLHVAEVRTPHIVEPESNQAITLPLSTYLKGTVPTARAMITMVSDRPAPAAKSATPSYPKPFFYIGRGIEDTERGTPFTPTTPTQLHYAVEVIDCFRADITHNFNPDLSKIQAIAQRQKAIETTEFIRNYTVISESCIMEENEVKSWLKTPESHSGNAVKATGVIYMPLRPNHEVEMDIFGCVDEILEGSSVIGWLCRQPFRYKKIFHSTLKEDLMTLQK